MKVADLLQFLQTLEAPLRTSGGTKVANDLRDACDALASFGDLPMPQFADFLKKADHYAKTGEVPLTATRSRRKAKPLDAEKVAAAAQTVAGLYERAIDAELDYSTIETELKRIEKSLSKDESLALAKEVDITRSLKTKKAAFEAIKERIFDRKQSFQRTAF